MSYTTLTSDKSRKTALILCIVGGMFGLHDYYLGNIGKGLIKTFTFNFFIFGWIRDIVKIATGGYRDNAGAPLRR